MACVQSAMTDGLDIAITLPATQGVGTGNLRTAQRWVGLFSELGHQARIFGPKEEPDGEVLVALNAVKSADAIARYRSEHPWGRLVVVVTGTDLNFREGEEFGHSLALADKVVVLQERALDLLTEEERAKASVIHQSVRVPPNLPGRGANEGFQVCVVGHLRSEKDPMLTAMASRVLEEESRVQVLHAGAILEEEYTAAVTLERQMNPRYQWLGELSKAESLKLIAGSDLMVLSSRSEGGPGVIGEAVSVGTPILASRIDGVLGLLGDSYPGYFEPGDVLALSKLLKRAEKAPDFYRELQQAGEAVSQQFEPSLEGERWSRLFDELSKR